MRRKFSQDSGGPSLSKAKSNEPKPKYKGRRGSTGKPALKLNLKQLEVQIDEAEQVLSDKSTVGMNDSSSSFSDDHDKVEQLLALDLEKAQNIARTSQFQRKMGNLKRASTYDIEN